MSDSFGSKYDVLITSAWLRSSYVALRSLDLYGLKVAVADEGKVGMSQWSNRGYFAGTYANPRTNATKFISDICKLLKDTGAKFLLPSHDETELLAKYRKELPSYVILPVTDYRSISIANNKGKMIDVAVSLGVPTPYTVDWDSVEDLQKKLSCIDYKQYVIKLRRGNSSKGVFYPESKGAVVSKAKELCKQYHLDQERFPVVQQRIGGEGWGVSCLYWNGDRVAFFTHRRVKEKVETGGTSTLRVSERNPVLEKYAFDILDKMNWHGLAMVEFKYCRKTKKAWFIEVNPRLWGSLHLAVFSGVDFPKLLYLVATNGIFSAREEAKPQREGVIARWYMGDIITSVSSLLDFKPVEAIKSLLPGHCDTYDDIHKDDLGAFAGEVAGYFSTFFKSRSLNPEKEGMLG